MCEQEHPRIMVRVQPGASRNEVSRFEDGVLYLKIAAPPIKGKANQELIKFISDILGTSKNNLIIEKGVTGKTKIIRIDTLTKNQVMEQLERRSK